MALLNQNMNSSCTSDSQVNLSLGWKNCLEDNSYIEISNAENYLTVIGWLIARFPFDVTA